MWRKTVRMYGHIRISSRWTLICILPGWLVAHRMAFLQMASCGAILFLIGSRCGQMAITGGCTVFLSSLGFMMCFVSIISGALMLTMLFRLLLRQPKNCLLYTSGRRQPGHAAHLHRRGRRGQAGPVHRHRELLVCQRQGLSLIHIWRRHPVIAFM